MVCRGLVLHIPSPHRGSNSIASSTPYRGEAKLRRKFLCFLSFSKKGSSFAYFSFKKSREEATAASSSRVAKAWGRPMPPASSAITPASTAR